MKKFIAALAVSTALLVTPAVAQSQNNCGSFEAAQALVDQYNEIPLVTYKSSKGEAILVYGNLETGTVTVFAAKGDRVCIVSDGVNLSIGESGVKAAKPGIDS